MNKSVLIPYDRYLYYKSLPSLREEGDVKKAESKNNAQISTDSAESSNKTNDIPPIDYLKDEKSDKLANAIILSHLPKRNHSKALSLLNVIEHNPQIDWNERGEILICNDLVPGSHISDILHDALNNTRHEPVGCKLFYEHMNHTPLSLISNPSRRLMLGGRRLPPPGLSDQKPVTLNSWKQIWRSNYDN